MPPNLQGLNIVHPALSQADSNSNDLLSGPTFPDLSAQIELWTNLAFDHDESTMHNSEEHGYRGSRGEYDDLDEEEDLSSGSRPAVHDAHVNVATGTTVPITAQRQQQRHPHNPLASLQFNSPLAQYVQNTLPHSSAGITTPSSVDLISFLTNIGIDPFSIPNLSAGAPSQPIIHPHQPPSNPSLAQLLQSAASGSSNFNSRLPSLPPSSAPSPAVSTPSPAPHSSSKTSSSSESAPATKRARSRKSSISTSVTTDDESPQSSNGVTPAEDKRKRNTAASARFRLKKKEREAALESRAKELEAKVAELERECEGLRRENGWLKGLVVGVTGAASQQSQSSTASAGLKRQREENGSPVVA